MQCHALQTQSCYNSEQQKDHSCVIVQPRFVLALSLLPKIKLFIPKWACPAVRDILVSLISVAGK